VRIIKRRGGNYIKSPKLNQSFQFMQISQNGIDFIAAHEGFIPHPYNDPASGGEPITIGYGTTHYPDGTKVTLQDAPISQDMAKSYLGDYISQNIYPVLNALPLPLNQNQFDALCSF
jgi:lysozyme